MKPQRLSDGERILAVFIDFENLALGFGGRRDRFSIDKVLERLVEKGKIVAKKAYADWSRFGYYTTSLHESAVELIEIPKRVITGKNSADIRMCVDAMDLAYSKDHIDTFVIVSGDSDFSPLVSKLKELGRDVIGLGLADSTSNLLRDNCDEFIYYEDLDRAPIIPLTEDESIPEMKRKVFALLLDSLLALRRENKELIFSSMVKDTMKRKKPSFNEEYHGYRTFSELLEDAQRHSIVDLEKHKNSGGTYVVTRFGAEPRLTENRLPESRPTPVALPANRTPRALPPAEPLRRHNPVRDDEPRRDELRREEARRDEPRRDEPRRDEARRDEPPAPPRRVVTLPPRPVVAALSPEPVEPPPPPRRVVTLPPKPIVAVKPPPPPARDDDDANDYRMPLGRALMDDISDDDDEIPSYMSRSVKAEPPKPREVGPNAKPRPAAKPPTKPAAPVRAPERPPVERVLERPIERPAPKPVAERPAPAPRPRPVAPPPPPPKREVEPIDDFGSGLD